MNSKDFVSPAPSVAEVRVQADAPSPAGVDAVDADLVRRIVEGDTRAAEQLYRRHVRYVLGVVVRLMRARSDADDVVQDTFVTALARIGDLRERGAVRAWLTRIAINYAHRRLRRQRLLRRLGFATNASDELQHMAAPETDAATRADLAKLDLVLSELPIAERLAWMLRHVEGMELSEAADALGCSLATVKRRIASAQKRISKHLQFEETTDE